MRLNRPVLSSMREPPERTTITPMLAHPDRSLPPGMQYVGHDGRGARARRARQQMRLEQKRLRKQYGSAAVSGRTDDGALVLDFPGPTRATPQD